MKRAPNFDRSAREAAARVLHIPASRIFIKVDEQHLAADGRPSILINWSDSMRCPESWDAVREAVRSVLPPKYQRYHLAIV